MLTNEWVREETYRDIVGTFNLQMLTNQLAEKYKTNIVASKVVGQTINDKYLVEVWYNFDSRCHVINIACTERIDNMINYENNKEESNSESNSGASV